MNLCVWQLRIMLLIVIGTIAIGVRVPGLLGCSDRLTIVQSLKTICN